jgi:hypothetical protein
MAMVHMVQKMKLSSTAEALSITFQRNQEAFYQCNTNTIMRFLARARMPS